MAGFAVELDGVDDLVFLQEVMSVLCQQRVDLLHVVLLGQIYGHVPLVEMNAAIDGQLDFATLQGKALGYACDTNKRGNNYCIRLYFGVLKISPYSPVGWCLCYLKFAHSSTQTIYLLLYRYSFGGFYFGAIMQSAKIAKMKCL